MKLSSFNVIVLTLCLSISINALTTCKSEFQDRQKLPVGKAVKIDGKIDTGEWADSRSVDILIESGWATKVHFKQDEENLYFRFSNLKLAEKKEFYPEVLIDTKHSRTKVWSKDHWWFHTSYQNCEGNGIINNYKSCSKGARTGWNGNNFDIDVGGDVEISISKQLLAVKKGDTIAMAFNVTNTRDKWLFYPANARLESPDTWASFVL